MKRIMNHYLLFEVIVYFIGLYIFLKIDDVIPNNIQYSLYYTIIYIIVFYILNIIYHLYNYFKHQLTPRITASSLTVYIAWTIRYIPLFNFLALGILFEYPNKFKTFIHNANNSNSMSNKKKCFAWIYWLLFPILILLICLFSFLADTHSNKYYSLLLLPICFIIFFRIYLIIYLGCAKKRKIFNDKYYQI